MAKTLPAICRVTLSAPPEGMTQGMATVPGFVAILGQVVEDARRVEGSVRV